MASEELTLASKLLLELQGRQGRFIRREAANFL